MTDELTERVARALANALRSTEVCDDMTFVGDAADYGDGPVITVDGEVGLVALATAAIAAVREAEGPTGNDLYYLRAIGRRLAEFQEALDGVEALSIGGEAFADERDWLDCYIDRLSRPLPTPPEGTE